MHRAYRRILITAHLVIFFNCASLPCTRASAAPVLRTHELLTIQADFTQPSDLVVGNNQRIYILDGVNNKVKVYSTSGDRLFSFGGTGSEGGQFNFPLGIGRDNADRIYVADSGNHRVQIFSAEGTYLSQFTTEVDKHAIKPSDPTDVVVNGTLKRCYVVDNDNHCLMLYDLEKMAPLGIKGTMGMEKKEFRYPFLLDIDSEGTLYVVEVINTRVKVLDPDGDYITNIGAWGVEKGELYRPKGVAIDPQRRVFVSDSYLGVIQVFDNEGRFLFILGDHNGAVKKFKTPTGIYIDNRMRLYVVEMLANRVTVLQVEGKSSH